MPRPIAIVGGSGAEGYGLALRFARAGAPVHIGSRDAAKAQATAQRIRDRFPEAAVDGSVNSAAVAAAEIVVLTVPLAAQIPTLKSVRASFRSGAILVDATVPLEAAVGGPSSRVLTLFSGSAAQQAARYVPEGVSVVSAFHTLSADALADLDHPLDHDVLLCGDQPEAKAAVRDLVAMLPGARAVDAGPLENSRLVEGLTALLVSLNSRHKAKRAGVRITGLEPGF